MDAPCRGPDLASRKVRTNARHGCQRHAAFDAPLQNYGPIDFADDLRWLCGYLGLERPIVVGPSMGGDIALKLAANVPDLVTAIVMIDCYECNPSAQLRNVSVDRTRLA